MLMLNNTHKRLIKIFTLFLILLFLIIIIPFAYSKYETFANSNVKSKVAYYILETNYEQINIKIPNLIPREEPYIHTFTISNNDGINRLETQLQYDLLIKTTTNLPLRYELYMNEDYTNPSANNIIELEQVVTDEYGTYVKEMKTSASYFTYLYDETNTYTLLVYFPKEYANYKYQDLIENIELIIDSKQIIE